MRPLDAGRALARARLHESTRQEPLFVDTFAEVLSSTSPLVSSLLMPREHSVIRVSVSSNSTLCIFFEGGLHWTDRVEVENIENTYKS